MAKHAALAAFDCSCISLKKTDAHRHDRGGGRDAPARCDRQSGQLHGHAARPDAEGWTYAAGDGIEVTVTFSETVKVEWRPSSAAIATTGSRSTTSCTASRAWS